MPRVARVLSAMMVKDLSSSVGDHLVGGAPGLILRVERSADGGTRAKWVLRRQSKVIRFTIGLGSYPAVSLKQARDVALETLMKAKAGFNPTEAKKALILQREEERAQEERSATERITVGDVYVEFFDWKEEREDWKRSAKARYREQCRFEKHLLPGLKDIPVAKCTVEDVANTLRPIWVSQPATCTRLLINLRGFFMWASSVKKIRPDDLINPADTKALSPFLPAQRARAQGKHMPFLAPAQVPAFFTSLCGKEGDVLACLLVGILTCSRSANVRQMRWDQIDFEKKIWTIPPEEMKVSSNGQHIVPLSTQAMEIIEKQLAYKRSDYVFTGAKGHPLSDMALNMLIRREHAKEKAQGREGWIDRSMSKEEGKDVIAVQHAIARASFETWAQGERKDPRTIGLCLHHIADSKLGSAYDRDASIEHKRKLLQEWADFCFSA